MPLFRETTESLRFRLGDFGVRLGFRILGLELEGRDLVLRILGLGLRTQDLRTVG